MKMVSMLMQLPLIADLKAMARDQGKTFASVVREACEKAVREWREQA